MFREQTPPEDNLEQAMAAATQEAYEAGKQVVEEPAPEKINELISREIKGLELQNRAEEVTRLHQARKEAEEAASNRDNQKAA